MKTKFIIFTWLFAIGLFSPVLLKAQEAPPANAKVISITTTENASVNISLGVIGVNTSVWIETSPGNFIKKSINGNDTSDYTVSGTSLKVYGDITYFRVYNQRTKVTALDVSQNTALKELNCYGNNLSTLDVSQNTALTWLFCANNNLSTLDVSQNTALTWLFCANNNLSTLDVSQNTALTSLYCYDNNLSTLDVSQNTALTILYCGGNNLSTLDVSQNTALTSLECQHNNLSTLDVSQNTALTSLECQHNNLSTLDVSQNTALTRLLCQNNKLTTLNVANSNNSHFVESTFPSYQIAFDATDNPNLQCIQIDEGFTPPINWYKDDTATWSNDCTNEQFTPPANSKVISITTTENATVNISLRAIAENTPVWIEISSDNYIKKLIGSSDWYISDYTVSGTSLKVYGDITYFRVDNQGTKVTALDVSQNTALKYLSCAGNNLSTLDVSQNTALKNLSCYSNNLSTLDVSQNTALEGLYCFSNNLSTLDVSQNTVLKYLSCYSNNLSSLDVSQNTALQYLWCHNNNLSSLDVSQNTALTRLFCQNNKLTALNVANGNNVNFVGHNNDTAFDATANPNLQCIQIDEGFTPSATGDNKWLKDNTANWSNDCTVPSFSITPVSKDFGEVIVNETSTQTFVIKNEGYVPLVISSASLGLANADQFSTTASPVTVAAGATTSFDVVFKPTTVGAKSAVLNIFHNAGDIPDILTQVNLSGVGKVLMPTFSITPDSKNFGEVTVNTTSTQNFVIINEGIEPLEISSVSLSGANADQFSTTLVTVAGGVVINFDVVFKPTTVGAKSAVLNIVHNAEGSPTQVNLNGVGTAVPTPTFSITPVSKNFGEVTVNTSSTQNFIVKNEGNAPLVISSASLSGANANQFSTTAAAVTVAAGATTNFDVVFKPTTVGAKVAVLNIVHNAGGSPTQVNLNGVGTAVPTPTFSITPVSKDFGEVTVNTNSTQNFIVKNEGNAPLVISSASLSGANANQFSTTAAAVTVAAGATTNFDVVFKPTTVGAKSAVLNIVHNAGGSPTQVNLNGTGTAVPTPTFSITPVSKNFGEVTVNTSSTQNFIVKNEGNAPLVISSASLSGANANQFSTTAAAVTVAAGATTSFDVVFKPTTVGAKSAVLNIVHNAGGSPTQVNLNGVGTAVPTPTFSITPVSKNFGEVTVNTNSTQNFIVKNEGNAPLVISSASLSGANANQFSTTAAAVTLAAGATTNFDVVFKPTTVGAKSAVLNIVHNAEGSPTQVNLNGVGTAVATPPNGAKLISLTTTADATISMKMKADVANTAIWIETSSGTYTQVNLSASWSELQSYVINGTTLNIYGDVTGFDCRSNGTKITSLDVSQNGVIKTLYAHDNNLESLDVANGNNANFVGDEGKAFDATGNSNLKCIQIDEGFTPPTTGDNKWLKDASANWSTNCAVSTNDIEENQSFIKVYPNPTKDFVTVSGLNEGLITKIEVFGVAGEKVMELSSNQTQVRVNLGTLSTGTYVIRISNKEQNQSFKLIKK